MKLKLAERMYRLGTETAFEVAARARALEAQGKPIIHLEIGEPDFDTPATFGRLRPRRSTRAIPTTAARRAFPSCAKPSRSTRASSVTLRSTPRTWS